MNWCNRKWSVTGLLLLCLALKNASALELQVVDATTEKPLPGVRVTWNSAASAAETQTTDAQGRVQISLPPDLRGTLRILARQPNFAPMTMSWDTDKVPAQFELRLPPAQIIEGRVVDDSGAPVAGADVTLSFPERLGGPRVAVRDFPVKSATNGSWRCEYVPKAAGYVRLEITHPDFESPPIIDLELFVASKSLSKLVSVSRVRGRVLDEAGRGIKGAELVLGGETQILTGSGTPETTTDAEGNFAFDRVRLEKWLLGANADGFAPALQLVDVKPGLAPLELSLNRGTPLRVRVLDDAGQPIPRVQVRVDEWPSRARNSGRWAYPGWEWETDNEGRFVWSNAPPESVSFTFSKGGYMGRGREALRASGAEQIVTLGQAFHTTGTAVDSARGQPLPEFVIGARFVQIDSVNGTMLTNYGRWHESNRKKFTGGEFALRYDHPLLQGARTMHAWQFRAEAEGYAPASSRVLRDGERGARLDFKLQPQPLPEIAVAAPSDVKRLAAGVAVQPVRVGLGETITVLVRVRLAPGFHIYALEDSGSKTIPTSLEASLPRVLQPDGAWRGPQAKVQEDGSRTLTGDLLFQRRFLVERGARMQKHKLRVQLRFQVCNDAVCWPPETIALEPEFDVVASEP